MKKSYYEHYCDNIENVENYEAAKKDDFVGWHCHHRLETHDSDGERRLVDITYKELIALDVYYHRPASELIFLTVAEHYRLHHKGKKLSEEAKAKMSEARKGRHLSEEWRRKISESRKGKKLGPRSEETKAKMSAAHKGQSAWNKGKKHSEEAKAKMSESHKGHQCSEETKKKIAEARKGKHWKLVDGKRVLY